jgi:hypothetical protein
MNAGLNGLCEHWRGRDAGGLMDASEFERRARNRALTGEDLETLKVNALAKGHRDFAAIANTVLLERFPSYAKKSGGATPTTAMCRGVEREFSSGKDAYVWLVERFRENHPPLLENQDRWHQQAFKGVKRKYFARSVQDLFPASSNLSEQTGSFSALAGGWYANANMNHDQKFQILLRLAAICGLSYSTDWEFKVTGATIALAERQAMVRLANEWLEEMRSA